MKKYRKLLMIFGIVLSLAVATGTTLAYLADTDSDVNVMTLGKVDITQLENGEAENGFENGQPLYPAYYEDEIDWETNEGVVDKEVTVENNGKSDAYVRTWFAFEAGEMDFNEFRQYILLNLKDGDEWTWEWDETTSYTIKNENGEESKYYIAVATREEVLPAGETTGASLVDVAMSKEATNEIVKAMGDYYTVLVMTQALQVNGFEETGAAAALAEGFGDVAVENGAIGVNCPWDEGFIQNYPVPADLWDGTADTSWFDAEKATAATEENPVEFVVDTAEEFAGFMKLTSSYSFKNVTVKLGNDIDMNGSEHNWNGDGSWGKYDNPFNGTFDGDGHTISNLSANNGWTYANALFRTITHDATIKNLILRDIFIDSNGKTNGRQYAVLVGVVGNNTLNIENVQVFDSRVAAGYANGILVGCITEGAIYYKDIVIDGCEVEDYMVTGERQSGSLLGDGYSYHDYDYSGIFMDNISVTNTTLTVKGELQAEIPLHNYEK